MHFAKAYLSKAAPVEPTIQNGRVVARLTCSECGAKDEWTVASKMPPPEVLAKHFSNKGWLVRKKPSCPTCRIKILKGVARCQHLLIKATATTDSKQEAPIMSNIAPIKTEQAPTEAVKAARRKANEFLMFHFDVEKGRYEDGWSDERVAKDSGMPVAWVIKRRDEEYGPLKEPSEFAQLRKEMASLADRVADLTDEVNTLGMRMKEMARKNGWSD